MEWQDEGIVIGVRRLGETSVILEAMTRHHGRHLGVVRGGRSRRYQPSLQAGNGCTLIWRARLDEQLGTYALEPTELRAARFMDSAAALYGLSTLCSLLRLLPERDPHQGIFDAFKVVVDQLHEPQMAAPLLIRFELAILSELGFGLDLTECAASGSNDRLIYVSPKTGRAVSEAAGEAYRDRLLALPGFLSGATHYSLPTQADIMAGFVLTGHFLDRNLFSPRGLAVPDARTAFVEAVMRGSNGT